MRNGLEGLRVQVLDPWRESPAEQPGAEQNPGVNCDGCEKRSFTGPRFTKTTPGSDYDLCAGCYSAELTRAAAD